MKKLLSIKIENDDIKHTINYNAVILSSHEMVALLNLIDSAITDFLYGNEKK